MNDKMIDSIVEQILFRMRKPTLMVLTSANGYLQEIASHLSDWSGIQWHILSDQSLKQEQQAVCHLGKPVYWDGMNPSQWLSQYEQVLFPFFNLTTLGEVSNGLLLTHASQIFQYSLMKGIPTYALNYQCDLSSELNDALGLNKNLILCERNKSQLQYIRDVGVNIGMLGEVKSLILNKDLIVKGCECEKNSSKYVTLNDVKEKGGRTYTLKDNLTDLAADYIKNNK